MIGMNWKSILPVLLLTLSHCASTLETAQRPVDRPEVHPEIASEELFTRGVALARNGQLIRAEQYLYLAMQSGYSEMRILPLLLKICLSTSRMRTALNYAQPYLTRHPESWMLRYLVASIYLALEQPLEARDQLSRVVRDFPAHAPAYYLLAVISRDVLNDDASTRRHFNAYLQYDPMGTHAGEANAWLRDRAIDTSVPTHHDIVHAAGRNGGSP
jgi:predicted Zn-dependent protease